MKPRWFFLALVGVICVLIATTYVPTPRQDVAVLDRLAPRIERSQTLAPQARDKIMQVINRARAPTGDARNDLRRSVTIERVTEAIKAKDNGSPEPVGTTGQAPAK
jgi:hypothetical protein